MILTFSSTCLLCFAYLLFVLAFYLISWVVQTRDRRWVWCFCFLLSLIAPIEGNGHRAWRSWVCFLRTSNISQLLFIFNSLYIVPVTLFCHFGLDLFFLSCSSWAYVRWFCGVGELRDFVSLLLMALYVRRAKSQARNSTT